MLVFVPERIRVLDRDPGVFVDAPDRRAYAGIHAGGDREPCPGPADRGDHVGVVERRIGPGDDQPAGPGCDRIRQRLGDRPRRTACGVRSPAPQPGSGDHRRGQRTGHGSDQRIQPVHPRVAIPGGLLGIPMRLAHRVIDIDEGHLLRTGQQRGVRGQVAQNREAIPSSWRTCPNVKLRRKVPSVDGARTPANNRSIPPWRSRSMSSIESAPAAMPPISAGTFRCTFAAPSPDSVSRWPASAARSHRSASDITGTSPATDTRLGSSKTAETPCETCIYRMPFLISDMEPLQVPSSQVRRAFVCYGTPSHPNQVGGSGLKEADNKHNRSTWSSTISLRWIAMTSMPSYRVFTRTLSSPSSQIGRAHV